MAGPVGSGPYSNRKRVFVLVADNNVQGVFTSWDAAEEFAERNSLPLDKLMEYETPRSDPDHLHLMSVQWENTWAYHGQWPKKTPNWPYPPKKVRIDHYHLRDNRFYLFRQKEFEWQNDLFLKINPMAPDRALGPAGPAVRTDTGLKQVAPSKGLKPISGTAEKTDKPADSAPEEKPKPAAEPAQPEKEKPQVKLAQPGTIQKKTEEKTEESKPEQQKQPAKPSEGKKKPALRLRSGKSPQPIPTFEAAKKVEEQSVSSVELAYSDPASAPKKRASEQATGPVKRIWSLKLIFPLIALFACWTGGVWWALIPEPTADMKVAEVATLNGATKIVLEPDTVFFQFPVDPIHQERWIQTIGMKPIDDTVGIRIPTHHALSQWEKPNTYIRPPYALVEVDEWLNIMQRDVRFGFQLNWEDGSILILDLESDQMIGWASISEIDKIMN